MKKIFLCLLIVALSFCSFGFLYSNEQINNIEYNNTSNVFIDKNNVSNNRLLFDSDVSLDHLPLDKSIETDYNNDINSDVTSEITENNTKDCFLADNIAVKHASRKVYLGGIPLGIDVKSNGLIITGKQEVITENGVVMPCKDIELKAGDMLVAIDDNKVFSERDVVENIVGKGQVTLTILSGEKLSNYQINTAIDVLSHSERIGLWLKDGITGIGTLTFVDGESRRYGALGHPIEEGKSYRSGFIYNANINGYIKGEKGKAGELDGSIISSRPIGTIDKNSTFGIYGTYTQKLNDMKLIEVASRDEIRPGKAQIYTTIEGGTPKYYDIEVIKKSVQLKPQNKGLVIRITDEELLNRTNGILQGMSGSPIIQNGKLIGAVTHVFINDPTKGFGMYIDFMLDN